MLAAECGAIYCIAKAMGKNAVLSFLGKLAAWIVIIGLCYVFWDSVMTVFIGLFLLALIVTSVISGGRFGMTAGSGKSYELKDDDPSNPRPGY